MAAKSSKAAKARAAAAAPYVRRVLSDQELRDNVRVAVDSAREAFARLQNGKGPAKVVLEDKKFKKSIQDAAAALKDASESLRDAPRHPKPKRGGLMRKLFVIAIAAGIALALSEDLRNKVLDALFGNEEEFSYSSSENGASSDAAPATPAPAA